MADKGVRERLIFWQVRRDPAARASYQPKPRALTTTPPARARTPLEGQLVAVVRSRGGLPGAISQREPRESGQRKRATDFTKEKKRSVESEEQRETTRGGLERRRLSE